MVPSKLKRHLSTKHSSLLNKDVNYFRRLLEQNRKQAAFMTTTVCVSDKVQKASYKISELIVKAKKPHTIAETLLMPACKQMVKIVLGSEAASEISKPVKKYFNNEYVLQIELKWKDCVSVCTDGAAAMTGRVKGFVAQVREINPNIRCDHCLIHREAIVVKYLPPSPKAVLDEVVKVVNLVKSRPLNSRLFFVLCQEMESEHTTLLLHTEVRWLSRGKVLTRISEFKDEVVRIFLTVEGHEYADLQMMNGIGSRSILESVEDIDWVCNPFVAISESLPIHLQEELAELKADRTLKLKLLEVPLDTFWLTVKSEYPAISEMAVNMLLPFSTTYLCELGFSTLTEIKTSKRERLRSIDEEMRVALSTVPPRIIRLCAAKQTQISH
ncbi:SCAN domain-containing protein 3-like [Centruroides vittatus]|uniref:SCAN domain-containing protein 3-like n=1 Tax=Centruroides vittatus TaxID=120091 RepID=UPI00350F6497